MLKSLREPGNFLTVGILGGGQLSKMLATAAQKLGFRVYVFERFADSPAARVCDREFVGSWQSWEVLRNFAERCDVVTIESEFVPLGTLYWLESVTFVRPRPEALAKLQDKHTQKEVAQTAGFAVPPYQQVQNADEVEAFAQQYGFPVMLKSRLLGYDGYGNVLVQKPEDIPTALEQLKQRGGEAGVLVEAFVPFTKELALVCTRGSSGEIRYYPLVETVQQDGICRKVFAPAEVDPEIEMQVQQLAARLAELLNMQGTMAIELFLLQDGSILFNELAPRVHNAGHFTIEACFTSQFENHIRAITQLPLGNTEMIVPAAGMVNILGTRKGEPFLPQPERLFQIEKVSIHFYGKSALRPRRKMGHVTILGEDREMVHRQMEQVEQVLQW